VSGLDDTIAAVATPVGQGGIGIVRVSGPLAEKIALRIFRPNRPISHLLSHHLYYGQIIDPKDRSVVDEVLLTIMRKPRTYTREDVLEINCHGGAVVLQRVLELTIRDGARLAEPGEFTRKAFINGRIDLTQAEAVVDIVRSKTEKGLLLAVQQLKGKIYEEVSEIRKRIIHVLSHIEASIDFPEEDIEILDPDELCSRMETGIIKPLEVIISNYQAGKMYREGLSTIIAGKPNVGKSSLLNVLLRENRAIVTSIPGTTRDVIEEFINIKGIPLKVVDTAGIAPPKDEIEAIGVEMARERLSEAELILLVVDVSNGLGRNDLELYLKVKEKPVIVVLNKIDLVSDSPPPMDLEAFSGKRIVRISALYNQGIDELKEVIFETIVKDGIGPNIPLFVPNARHKTAIEKAIDSLVQAKEGLNGHISPELIAVDIQSALDHLGELTGITTPDDVLNSIFSQFCIGK
jgi:tRNA modification GTPase